MEANYLVLCEEEIMKRGDIRKKPLGGTPASQCLTGFPFLEMTSTGSGISHSEYNRNPAKPVHFLQIWGLPTRVRLLAISAWVAPANIQHLSEERPHTKVLYSSLFRRGKTRRFRQGCCPRQLGRCSQQQELHWPRSCTLSLLPSSNKPVTDPSHT